jgi:hypothetical protein
LARASQRARRGSGHTSRSDSLGLTENAHADLQALLGELASALLPRGITPNSFSRLAREAFIRAAAGQARLRNGKFNHSKIAALTGLSRKEIRRILQHPAKFLESDLTARTPSERVVRGWLTDRRLLTRQNVPKRLALNGRALSFEWLVREYAGDVSSRAVLEELARSRMIFRVGKRLELQVTKLGNLRSGLGPLSRVIPTLVDGLRIASRKPSSSVGSALYRLRLQAATEAELALIRQRCSSAVQSLLHGLKESLEHEFTRPLRKRSSMHALTVTVFLAAAGNKSES